MNDQVGNFNELFLEATEKYATRDCFAFKRGGRYQEITYREFQNLAFRLANFFIQNGLAEGDRVAIIAENSPEWMAAYMSTLLSGAVVVPLSPSLTPEMLRFTLKDSGARLAVVGGIGESHIIEEAGRELTQLRKTIVMSDAVEHVQDAIPMRDVLAKFLTPPEINSVLKRARSIEPGALACIYYTASETDRPKGAMFNHAQLVLAMKYIADWFTFKEDDLAFTTINWSYIVSLHAALNYLFSGVANVLSESKEAVFENLQETSPTVVLTMPSAFENIYNNVTREINKLPESTRKVFHWALLTGREFYAAGLTASPELSERYARADLTFFSQIRAMIGGRLRRIYSSGAPLSQELAEFAEVIGLLPLNVYGTFEACGFPAANRPDARRPGSCGQVTRGFQVRIADDGEILIRGETVVKAYWGLPDEINRVKDRDGWFHTGDLGRFDQDGYLYITGYKQSLFMVSHGRKIMPSKIESDLMANPLIAEAVVFGEGRAYVSALIVPNYVVLSSQFQGAEEESGAVIINSSDSRVKMLVDKAVADVNRRLNVWERVEAYTLLDGPLSEEGGGLRSSMKINRSAVAEKYRLHIEAMYPLAIKLEEKAVTRVQLEPEQLRELLEKQDILDAWMKDAGIGFLFDLARAKQIDAPSMVHICETAASIAQMQSEEKPLSTALIVGDPFYISKILPESEIQLQRYDHIRRMRQVVISLARMVDGIVLGYGVDKHGFVRRIYKLEVSVEEQDSFLLGPQFRRHAAISRLCDAVVFFIPAGGRQVRVFADGQLMGRYSNGNWSSESIPRVNEAVARLAEQKKYDLRLLERIFRCAFMMSEDNLGAIFLLGSASVVLERSDPPALSTYATIGNADMTRLSDNELINFAKQDGATIIDVEQGKFRGCMVLLRPRADTQAEIGIGKGARHSSAAKMSAEAKCLAITVSQDGPITVYDCGQRVLSL